MIRVFDAGDWGYNTKKERDEAAGVSRIQILQLSDFSNKLKWSDLRSGQSLI